MRISDWSSDVCSSDLVRLDVTSEEQWRAVIDEAIARDGRIDALINNAGVATVKPITDATLEDVDFIFGVNFRGVFLGCRSVLPAMKGVGGSRVDRKSVVEGKRVSVRVDHGGRSIV